MFSQHPPNSCRTRGLAPYYGPHHPLPFLSRCLLVLFCVSLTHCGSTPPPPNPLPPSESDLTLLGKEKLCDNKTTATSTWLRHAVNEVPWGSGTEVFQEVFSPDRQGQWFMFNEDGILVGVITAYPHGLDLDPYPTLRETLSKLPPAREFYFNSAELLRGKAPDSATLYRTGERTTTHQYFIRHTKGQEDHLVIAVFLLDPYEPLLDGGHPKFLTYVEPTFTSPTSAKNGESSSNSSKEFLGLQQFARGEIALFSSCGKKEPHIAIEAYQRALDLGLPNEKQTAEAHHRLGLALLSIGKLPKAQVHIQQALALEPYSATMLNSLGTVFNQLEEFPKAVETFERALALQPNNVQARFNLAKALETINPKRAKQEYETFLILAENNPKYSANIVEANSKIQKIQGGRNP